MLYKPNKPQVCKSISGSKMNCLSRIFGSVSLLLTLLSFLQPTYCAYYYKAGYEIRDLLSTGNTCFESETSQWSASKLKSSKKHTTCNGIYLLGGQNILESTWYAPFQLGSYGQYFERKYSDLPNHQTIRFSMKIWAIDSWDNEDKFEIYFDGAIVTGWQIKSENFPSNICAGGFRDLPNIQVFGRRDHSGSSLTFRIISKFDEDTGNEAFGLRELTLLFVTSDESEDQCLKAPITQIGGQTTCQCPEGKYYKSSTASCESCHANCISCFGAGANQCYQCQTGKYFDGISCQNCDPSCSACSGPANNNCVACLTGSILIGSRCLPTNNCVSPLVQNTCANTCPLPCDASEFLYWDNSCSSTCNSPLQTSTITVGGVTIKKCNYPCGNTQYLYWNGACETSCASPLTSTTIKGKNLCTYSCTGTQYLYWNGTCLNGCNAPLIPVNKWGEEFCTYPCTGANDFLYQNGSCIASCTSPSISKTEGGKKFCIYRCASSQFLYWNYTCLSSCVSPLVQRTEGASQFCDYPCLTSQFLYWDGSCSNICPTPFLSKTVAFKKYCIYPCTSSEYLYPNSACQTSCTGVSSTEKGKNLCQPGCLVGEYLYWNGTCSSSCPFPLTQSTDSLSRPTCVHNCPDGEYLYWDGSCSSECNSPLESVTEGGKLFCRFPCLSGHYIHWNNSCSNECNLPLIPTDIKGKKICKFDCTTSQSPMLNGSCVDECPLPYTMKFYVNQYFCDFYCSVGQYLDTISRTCVNICPAEYFGYEERRSCEKCQVRSCKNCSTSAGQACDECLPDMMLNNQGLCIDCQVLQISYSKETDSGHQYIIKLIPSECDLDESFVQQYLQATEQSRIGLPPFSFQVKKKGKNSYTVDLSINGYLNETTSLNVTLKYLNATISVPKKFQETPLIKKFAELAPLVSATLAGAAVASAGGLVSLGASAALWNMINFQQFIGYFIYINVDYPPQTELFLSLFQFTSLDFLPNPFEKLVNMISSQVQSLKELENLEKYQPPKKFAKYEMGSFFIENGGSALSTSLGFVLAVYIIQVLRRVRILRIDLIMNKLIVLFKWNWVIRAFLENGIPLALAMFLQARKITHHTFYSAFSVALMFVAFIYYTLMMNFIIEVLVNKGAKTKVAASDRSCDTLFEGLALETECSKYYHWLILLRGVFLVFLEVFFEISPQFQIIPLILFNIGLVIFLFTKSRFESKGMNIVNRIKEMLILLGEIGIFLLTLESRTLSHYSNVGWGIVFFLGVALAAELSYTLMLQIFAIIALCRKIQSFWRKLKALSQKYFIKQKKI